MKLMSKFRITSGDKKHKSLHEEFYFMLLYTSTALWKLILYLSLHYICLITKQKSVSYKEQLFSIILSPSSEKEQNTAEDRILLSLSSKGSDTV